MTINEIGLHDLSKKLFIQQAMLIQKKGTPIIFISLIFSSLLVQLWFGCIFDRSVPSKESILVLRNASISNHQRGNYMKQMGNKHVIGEFELGHVLDGKVAEVLTNAGVNVTNLSSSTQRLLPSF